MASTQTRSQALAHTLCSPVGEDENASGLGCTRLSHGCHAIANKEIFLEVAIRNLSRGSQYCSARHCGSETFFDMKLVPLQIVCVIAACAVIFATKLIRANEKQLSPVVQTESGAVVGKIETLPQGKSVHEYLGIPYAEPPVGELRFAAPKPAKPWSGTEEATEFGATCPQPLIRLVENVTKSGMFLHGSPVRNRRLILVYLVTHKGK